MADDRGGAITRGFLFADLRGYTDFVEQRGAAAAAALLARYRALARDAIGRFGGAEIKTEGDSFYIVFDSVSSAVRCGLAIAADARAANAEHPQEPIHVGIGVHAGETIEADGGYVGSPVNIAARICAQAGAGEVLVSETVRALTRTLLPVAFRSRGRRGLKGIADPIELFAVEEATSWPSTPRRGLSHRTRGALAGGVAVVLAAAAAIGWLALRPSSGLPPGPWAIGVHVPTSGSPGAAEGIAVRNAVQLAVDETNEADGVAGVELAVKAHDTGGPDLEDPARSAAAAGEMVRDAQTIAAIGPLTTAGAHRTIPITNRAGLFECSPSTSGSELTKPEHGALELRASQPKRINFVRLSPSVDVLTRALAEFATHDLDAESALVIGDGDFFDSELGGPFEEAFAALGGQVERVTLRAATPSAALQLLRRADPRPDVVVFAGSTESGAPVVRKAMSAAGLGSTPFVSWDTILDGSGAFQGSYLQRAGKAAAGTYTGHTSIAPPRADFVSEYRAAFGEEPTEYAAAAYACMQVILASLDAIAEDGPDAERLRESLRAHAVDPTHRYETVLGTVGFDANGDSTQQFVSFLRVDPTAADGAGDWVFLKQQDFGPPP
jgi:class 3 adenylate cyclase/ABC-type branched-subunit amino acid transport system substrate-binding protein